MAYKKVVEMLGENPASLLELAKKWLITWNIHLRKILHVLQNIKKSDLQGLIDGTHEIIQKSPLVKTGLMIVKAFSGNITELFSEQKTGKDKQWHSSNFKKLLKSIGTNIEVSETKIQKYVLKKRMSYFDIRNFIGLEKLIYKTKAAALATLHATMTDEYRDGKINIVYYLDENGVLCYADCYWVADAAEWYCRAYSADADEWRVGDRVFYPALILGIWEPC